MNRRSFALGAIATPLAVSTMTLAQTPPATPAGGTASADVVADALYAANPTPALSLAAARSTGPIWSRVYGQANLELEVPTSLDHRFRLGSVSKVLTATLAARLVSQGVIELDAPISALMPDLPEQHHNTTLRQLFTHRGGIRHYTEQDFNPFAPGGAIFQRIYPSNDDILELFINDPLVAEPGTEVNYSSFGFTLASIVMETAAGRPFSDLLLADLGEPFGLNSLAIDIPYDITPMRVAGYTSVDELAAVSPPLAAYWTAEIEGPWANLPQYNSAYVIAGGGMLLTPSDMAKFGAAMVPSSGSPLTSEERDLLFTPIPSDPMGFAWRIDSDDQGRLRWHHAGATGGGRASLVVYPELDLSIAFATNVASIPDDVLQPSSDLADAFSH